MSTPSADLPRHDVPNGGRSGFTIIEGRQVHYLEWGPAGAPAVLCLHGGGQTAYMYEELGAALSPRPGEADMNKNRSAPSSQSR